MTNNQAVELEPYGLSIADVVAVARHDAHVRIPDHVLDSVSHSREAIEALAQADRPVYGVSTGFGALAQRHIPQSSRTQLQKSLVRSHAAGIGEPVEREVVRALMLLRARTLATGRTGVRREVLKTYVDILNAGIIPLVYEHGSLGCSGDLAPLAACAMVVMGEGEVVDENGVVIDAADALAKANIEPIVLVEKEGLALLNGTDGMLGMLILALTDLESLLSTADISAAMSVEALHGTGQVFRPELFEPLRPHPGQTLSAANMLAVLKDSAIVKSHKDSDHRVQDAYSLRCAPQVTGAARDTIEFALQTAKRELLSAIDNPVVLDSGEVSSNGNFHGAPLAYAMDFLAIAAADVASIAERRTDRLMDKDRSDGLPPFLANDAGVDSGFMIAHYTQAAMVSESKRLATPASVDSIPSSAMQEDHVSMGWGAARKLRKSIKNLTAVLAVEIYAAARGIELRGVAPSPATGGVVRLIQDHAGRPGPDRFLSPELEAVVRLVDENRIVAAVEKVVELGHTIK